MDSTKKEFITDDLFSKSLIAHLRTKPEEKEMKFFIFL